MYGISFFYLNLLDQINYFLYNYVSIKSLTHTVDSLLACKDIQHYLHAELVQECNPNNRDLVLIVPSSAQKLEEGNGSHQHSCSLESFFPKPGVTCVFNDIHQVPVLAL